MVEGYVDGTVHAHVGAVFGIVLILLTHVASPDEFAVHLYLLHHRSRDVNILRHEVYLVYAHSRTLLGLQYDGSSRLVHRSRLHLHYSIRLVSLSLHRRHGECRGAQGYVDRHHLVALQF